MIVVDVGCVEWETETSIDKLVERFHPERLYGFDPALGQESQLYRISETTVFCERKAAWTREGWVGFQLDGPSSRVIDSPAGMMPCFDLAAYLDGLSDDIVLKVDAEGAEYVLLPHLHATGADAAVSLALVEWHGEARIELRCPIEEWA